MNPETSKDVSLDIIIVNWNAGLQIRRCLDSIVAADVPFVSRVVVVDNGSTDGSADALRPPPSLTILRNPGNRGFAAACNRVTPGVFGTNFMADWDHADSREVDVVTGAFLLIRRAPALLGRGAEAD